MGEFVVRESNFLAYQPYWMRLGVTSYSYILYKDSLYDPRRKNDVFFLVLDKLTPDTNDLDPLPMSLIEAQEIVSKNIESVDFVWDKYYDHVWSLDNTPVVERSRVVDNYRMLPINNNNNYY